MPLTPSTGWVAAPVRGSPSIGTVGRHASECWVAMTRYAHTVIKREGKDDYWLNLGVVFAHEDGEGFNILLQALPTDAKLVLRTYKEKPEEQEKVIKAKFKK